jgi:ATP-dependent DNA ligase
LHDNSSQFLEVAPKEECKGMHHMQEFLQDILNLGGEGIILRNPLTPNQAGRSVGYLKHKVCIVLLFYCDYDSISLLD